MRPGGWWTVPRSEMMRSVRSVLAGWRRGAARAAAFAGVWLSARAALADPPPPTPQAGAVDPAAAYVRVEQAREAFRVGAALAKEGQWVDALPQFERSARLRPHAVTTFNIGFCERALGRYTRAKRSFVHALSAPESELPAHLAAEARGYLAEIDSRVSRALTTLSPAGAAVSVDGRPLEVAAADGAHVELVAGTREAGPAEAVSASFFQIVLDPGTHVIVVRAPGVPEAVLARTFAPGATVPLTLGSAPAAATAAAALPPRHMGAIAAFSIGALGLADAVIFGGLAVSKSSYLHGVCAATCPEDAQPSIDAMNTFAKASTPGAVVAGAGAALGTVLWLTAPSGEGRAPGLGLAPSEVTVHVSF